MTAPSTEELDHLAEVLASNTAPWLAWAVHHRDKRLIDELVEPFDFQQLRALVVVLASQVPQPRTRPNDGIVDEVAVRRAADGDVGPLTREERAEAIRLMHRRGEPIREILRRLHVTTMTVDRVMGKTGDDAAEEVA